MRADKWVERHGEKIGRGERHHDEVFDAAHDRAPPKSRLAGIFLSRERHFHIGVRLDGRDGQFVDAGGTVIFDFHAVKVDGLLRFPVRPQTG